MSDIKRRKYSVQALSGAAVAMRHIIIFLVGLFALQGTVMGDDVPSCPQRTAMQDYHCHSFHGEWYILLRTASNTFEEGDTCSRIIIEERDNGTTAFRTKYVKPGESEYSVLEGNYWRTEDAGNDGKAWINYPENYGQWQTVYHILGTDYISYAVTWTCWVSKKGVLHDHAWVLGRDHQLTEEMRQKATEITEANNLDMNNFVSVSQADCPAE